MSGSPKPCSSWIEMTLHSNAIYATYVIVASMKWDKLVRHHGVLGSRERLLKEASGGVRLFRLS